MKIGLDDQPFKMLILSVSCRLLVCQFQEDEA